MALSGSDLRRKVPIPDPPIDLWGPPVPTSGVALFEPPSALTDGRHEVWLAAGGVLGWGGCEVYVSITGTSYMSVGYINRGACVGQLIGSLPAEDGSAATIDVSRSCGVIPPGSPADADALTTLCWIGGELIAYTEATLIAPYTYRLDGTIHRGTLDTPVKTHLPNSPFARLNLAIFRYPYPAHLVGRSVYVKLPAHNLFGNRPEGLDEVEAHSLILTGTSAS